MAQKTQKIMVNPSRHFPENFYWGAATSAHQVEGNNRNDWTEWEKSEFRIKNLEFRIRSGEFRKKLPPYLWDNWPTPDDIENYISGRACDHYHRFREDFDIAKSLGHNAHRFSIEWSRIEPEEGKFDEKEIEHYRKVIKALRERGMEPFVTLWHWTLPIWIAKQGGWKSSKTIGYFVKFCERMGGEFRNEVKYWITLNEPGMFAAHAYLLGIWPPQKKNIFTTARIYFNLMKAHREAYKKLKEINSNFFVGISEAASWPAYRWLRPAVYFLNNFFFLDRVSGSLDFIGINYYRRTRIGRCRSCPASDMGWEIYPEGIYRVTKEAWHRYQKPIFITENGIADVRDEKRAEFIHEHLRFILLAVEEGMDVRGYFHWSLLDNFEWDKGFWPRFGLIEIDYKTAERRIRKSALEYKKIIETHRNSIEIH